MATWPETDDQRGRRLLTKASSCDGKARHQTKLGARKALAKHCQAKRTRRDDMVVYHCLHCGCYHVGHAPRVR